MTDIKSNNPHLTGGEKCKISGRIQKPRTPMWKNKIPHLNAGQDKYGPKLQKKVRFFGNLFS